MIKKRIVDYYPLIVLICFLFINFFGLNPKMFEDNSVYNYISVPYIPMNITIACFIISLFGIIIMVYNKQLKFDIIAWLLFARSILYIITSFFVNEVDYKIGDCYAIVQCLFAYLIARNYKKDLKYINIAVLIFTIFICIEIFYIPIVNNVNFFPVAGSPSKPYMVLPMGKHNYITCILIPSYLLLSNCLLKNYKLYILYTILIGLAVLVTLSRWGLIVFIIFTLINNLKNIKKLLTQKKLINKFLIAITIILLAILFLFTPIKNILNNVVSRYSFSIFSSRLQIFKESFDLFLKHPIFGRTAYSYQVYNANGAHNFILESLIQTGIVGTGILLYCLYLVIKKLNTIDNNNIRKGYLLFISAHLFQGLAEPNLLGLRSDFLFWLIIGFGVAEATKYK